MTNQSPMNEIFAVIDRDARKVFEGRCYEIIVITNATDTRVRSHSRDYRLIKTCIRCDGLRSHGNIEAETQQENACSQKEPKRKERSSFAGRNRSCWRDHFAALLKNLKKCRV